MLILLRWLTEPFSNNSYTVTMLTIPLASAAGNEQSCQFLVAHGPYTVGVGDWRRTIAYIRLTFAHILRRPTVATIAVMFKFTLHAHPPTFAQNKT